MAASGKIIKMEVDFSDTVDKKLPEYQQLAQVCSYIHSLILLCAYQYNTLCVWENSMC